MSGGEGGFTFEEIYSFFVFLCALWVVGKISVQIKLPALVGEIICGLILGPNLLHFAPYSNVLKMIGECGLILLVIEAGIEVDLDILKLIGTRGVIVAVFGSMTPLAIGFGLGTALGYDPTSSLCIGACLAPTSMGIAVSALRRGKALNTTIGQLVIAAAVLDDIISLVLLSVIQALANPTPWSLAKPVVVSLGFLLGFGYIGIVVMPKVLPKFLNLFDHNLHEYVLLGSVMVMAMALIPATNSAGTSYLLGAFLSGLCFCHDHHVHHIWNKQMKRLMAWLLRLFFSCTIGFEVPIKDVWTAEIMTNTLIFFTAILGKLATGMFAPAPWRLLDAIKLGSAMSAWGEFAFIIATVSYSDHLLDKKQFSAVVMAVLISVIFGPICLTAALDADNKKKAEKLDAMKNENEEIMISKNMSNFVYFKIQTKSQGFWGFYQKIENKIASLDLEVIDYRTSVTYGETPKYVMTEFYVRDTVSYTTDEPSKLDKRRRAIVGNVGRALRDPAGNVAVERWLPMIREEDSKRILALQNVHDVTQFDADQGNPLRLGFGYKRRHCLTPEATLVQVSKKMATEDVSAVLIIEDSLSETDRPLVLGMVTRSDVIYDIPKHGVEEKHHARDVMTLTKNLLVCDKNACRQEILREMAAGNCQNMVLIDLATGEVDAVVNIKELVGDVVEASAHSIQVMNSVLTQHYDDSYDSDMEEQEYGYSRGRKKEVKNPLQGPFHDGKPVTWDVWQRLSTTGSFCLADPAQAAAFMQNLGLDDSDENGGGDEDVKSGSVSMAKINGKARAVEV